MDDVELEEELLGGSDFDSGLVVQSLTVEEEELLLAGDDDFSKGHDREWRSERRERDRSPLTCRTSNFKQEVIESDEGESRRSVKERLGPMPTITLKEELQETVAVPETKASINEDNLAPLVVKRDIEEVDDDDDDDDHKHSKRSKFHSERETEVGAQTYHDGN